jgi:hypothetical protein
LSRKCQPISTITAAFTKERQINDSCSIYQSLGRLPEIANRFANKCKWVVGQPLGVGAAQLMGTALVFGARTVNVKSNGECFDLEF